MNTLKLKGKGAFRNSLLDIPFSYEELMEFLKKQPLYFDRDKFSEYFPAPSMSKTFYNYLFDKCKMPTQDEYCDYFIDFNKKEIDEKIASLARYAPYPDKTIHGLKARAARTYPSLIRDLHMSMRMAYEGWDIFWNPMIDVDCKTDMVINKDGKLYGIAMYTDTKRGMECRSRKLGETDMPTEFIKIELPIKLDDGEKVGMFKLYGAKHIKLLADKIA